MATGTKTQGNLTRSEKPHFIGTGIYSIPEASKLAGVTRWRIRRWVKGYLYKVRDEMRRSPSIIVGLTPADGVVALSFLDLLEVRLIDAFLNAGVSWKVLRAAHQLGRTELNTDHPFAAFRFRTDGRRVFLDLQKEIAESELLLDVVSSQLSFSDFVSPYFKDLDFGKDRQEALRWWPMGKNRPILVDPQRTFGQPIVSDEGVATSVLFKSYRVEKSIDIVSRWFRVPKTSVEAAVEFELKLAA